MKKAFKFTHLVVFVVLLAMSSTALSAIRCVDMGAGNISGKLEAEIKGKDIYIQVSNSPVKVPLMNWKNHFGHKPPKIFEIGGGRIVSISRGETGEVYFQMWKEKNGEFKLQDFAGDNHSKSNFFLAMYSMAVNKGLDVVYPREKGEDPAWNGRNFAELGFTLLPSLAVKGFQKVKEKIRYLIYGSKAEIIKAASDMNVLAMGENQFLVSLRMGSGSKISVWEIRESFLPNGKDSIRKLSEIDVPVNRMTFIDPAIKLPKGSAYFVSTEPGAKDSQIYKLQVLDGKILVRPELSLPKRSSVTGLEVIGPKSFVLEQQFGAKLELYRELTTYSHPTGHSSYLIQEPIRLDGPRIRKVLDFEGVVDRYRIGRTKDGSLLQKASKPVVMPFRAEENLHIIQDGVLLQLRNDRLQRQPVNAEGWEVKRAISLIELIDKSTRVDLVGLKKALSDSNNIVVARSTEDGLIAVTDAKNGFRYELVMEMLYPGNELPQLVLRNVVPIGEQTSITHIGVREKSKTPTWVGEGEYKVPVYDKDLDQFDIQ